MVEFPISSLRKNDRVWFLLSENSVFIYIINDPISATIYSYLVVSWTYFKTTLGVMGCLQSLVAREKIQKISLTEKKSQASSWATQKSRYLHWSSVCQWCNLPWEKICQTVYTTVPQNWFSDCHIENILCIPFSIPINEIVVNMVNQLHITAPS